MNTRIEYLRKKANSLPLLPGVYIMKNSEGQIIYVGKAKILKNRVTTYFRKLPDQFSKVSRMVQQVYDFDYILCDSEYEALVLECSLIKQNKPKYNILLKDDKGYSYLKISSDEWSTLKAVFQKDDKKAKYLGPYYSHYIIKSALDEAVKIFKIPTCNKSFPRDYKKSRPCLNYHIGLCSAPCAGKISKEEYLVSINNAISFIKGGKANTINELKVLMNQAAEELRFEDAAKYRNQIKAMELSIEKQKVISSNLKELDVISTAVLDKVVSISLFVFKDYHLYDCRNYIFKDVEDISEVRSDFIKQHYFSNECPHKIFVDGEIKDKDLILEYLQNKNSKKIEIIIPQKGKNLELIKMASLNAAEFLAQNINSSTHETAALDELTKLFKLPKTPKIIEAYDISHTAGANSVGGLIVFKNGKSYKKGYRKFIIKSGVGGDDYSSLREVLARRFNEYESNNEDETFKCLPDLILIDGAEGQINAVKSITNKYNIPVFGMVKDSKHKTRAITNNGKIISIKANKRAYNLIYNIQEEVHRFSIQYHRSLSTKNGITSELLNISGVGEARAKLLFKEFKSIDKISSLTVEELSKVVPKNVAEKIYFYYN